MNEAVSTFGVQRLSDHESYIHTYITSRPFAFGVGRDHFLPLATIFTHTFRFFHCHQILHTRMNDQNFIYKVPLCLEGQVKSLVLAATFAAVSTHQSTPGGIWLFLLICS
jgi:hypothetical protein